jgi:hypothetical protein
LQILNIAILIDSMSDHHDSKAVCGTGTFSLKNEATKNTPILHGVAAMRAILKGG